MSRSGKVILVVVCSFQLLFVILSIPAWKDDSKVRKNKVRLHELVKVGDVADEAAAVLRKAGFGVSGGTKSEGYKKRPDYIVYLRSGGPNFFDGIAYAAQAPWMPFTHKERQWVALKEDSDGAIIKIW